MRKLIRILAGVVLASAFFALHASPVLAEHGVGVDPDGPAGPAPDPVVPPAGPGVLDSDPAGWHEDQPDFAIAQPADPCIVTGTVEPGAAFDHDPHLPGESIPLVNDDPAHSHFEFLNTVINCVSAGSLGVDAEGGNDGHAVDILDPANPVGGANGAPLELDLDSDESLGLCSTVHPDLCLGQPTDEGWPAGADQHDFNNHHGSVNESGWSHSGFYSGGTVGLESNECGTPADAANTLNKADINITLPPPVSTTHGGWVKYVRIGVVVYAWGCVDLPTDTNDVFSSVLVILPNLLPADPTGTFPSGLFNPLCPLDFLNDPPFGLGGPMSSCGFILAGVAWRGPDWL